jgi:hypothetical protein
VAADVWAGRPVHGTWASRRRHAPAARHGRHGGRLRSHVMSVHAHRAVHADRVLGIHRTSLRRGRWLLLLLLYVTMRVWGMHHHLLLLLLLLSVLRAGQGRRRDATL